MALTALAIPNVFPVPPYMTSQGFSLVANYLTDVVGTAPDRLSFVDDVGIHEWIDRR
jgi:hypothetical protein